jgi:hypothetical protein
MRENINYGDYDIYIEYNDVSHDIHKSYVYIEIIHKQDCDKKCKSICEQIRNTFSKNNKKALGKTHLEDMYAIKILASDLNIMHPNGMEYFYNLMLKCLKKTDCYSVSFKILASQYIELLKINFNAPFFFCIKRTLYSFKLIQTSSNLFLL